MASGTSKRRLPGARIGRPSDKPVAPPVSAPLSVFREVRAMSIKTGKKRTGRLALPSFAVKFTDRDVKAILSHVSVVEPKKADRLGDVLRDWAKHDIPTAFRIYPDKAVARERLKAIRCVLKHAQGLRDALENFEKFDGSSWLVQRLIDGLTGDDHSTAKAMQTCRIVEHQVFLRELESAAKAIERGFAAATDQRRNLSSYLLLLDMAAIFEWLTGRPARRGSEDRPHPFDEFVGVLWSVIFDQTRGMQAALKNWARYTKEFDERSALVANINFRHPDWRLFDSDYPKPST
jgi:hypothetical protein